jgi:transposase
MEELITVTLRCSAEGRASKGDGHPSFKLYGRSSFEAQRYRASHLRMTERGFAARHLRMTEKASLYKKKPAQETGKGSRLASHRNLKNHSPSP